VFWDVDVDLRHFPNSTDKEVGDGSVTATVTLIYENFMDNGEIQEQKEVIVIDSSKMLVSYFVSI
jgi:hypothetical protein